VETRAEEELVSSAAKGDHRAFVELFGRHHQAVFRFAYRFSGSAATAEDITQDSFLALLRSPGRYDPARGPVRAWLLGVARTLLLKQFRRLHPESPLDEIADSADERPGPESCSLSSEIAETVREAVQALPPLQREALILFEYEELSLAEIANITGADVAAVKSRLFRALEKLRGMKALNAPLMHLTTKD
jgi:RNA polymerase sigma-70 factor (ECF subfamily)